MMSSSKNRSSNDKVSDILHLTRAVNEFTETEYIFVRDAKNTAHFIEEILENPRLNESLSDAEVDLLRKAKTAYSSIEYLYEEMDRVSKELTPSVNTDASDIFTSSSVYSDESTPDISNDQNGSNTENKEYFSELRILTSLKILHDIYRAKPKEQEHHVAENLAAQFWISLNYPHINNIIQKLNADELNKIDNDGKKRLAVIAPVQRSPRIKLLFENFRKAASGLSHEIKQEIDILNEKITAFCSDLNMFLEIYEAICVEPGEEFDLDVAKNLIISVNLNATLATMSVKDSKGEQAVEACKFFNELIISYLGMNRIGEIKELNDNQKKLVEMIRNQIILIEENNCSLQDLNSMFINLSIYVKSFYLTLYDECKGRNISDEIFAKRKFLNDILLVFKENLTKCFEVDGVSPITPGMSVMEINKKFHLMFADKKDNIKFKCKPCFPVQLSDEKENQGSNSHERDKGKGKEREENGSGFDESDSNESIELEKNPATITESPDSGSDKEDDNNDSGSEIKPVLESPSSQNASASTSTSSNASISAEKDLIVSTRLLECARQINIYLAERANQTNGRFFGLFRYSAKDYLDRQRNWELILHKLNKINNNQDQIDKKKDIDSLYEFIQTSKMKFYKLGNSHHYYDLLCRLGTWINIEPRYMLIGDETKSYINSSLAIHKTQREYLQNTKKYLSNHFWTNKVTDEADFNNSCSKHTEYKQSIIATNSKQQEFLTPDELCGFALK